MSLYNFYITPEEYDIAAGNGISRHTLDVRIRDLLWDKEKAITEPTQKKDYSLSEWADIAESNGIKRGTFYMRVRRGGDPNKAATEKVQCKKTWSNKMRKRRTFKYPNHVYEQARQNGISYSSLKHRMKSSNFTDEEVYTMKPLSSEESARRSHEARNRKGSTSHVNMYQV